ncbi:C4-dicarboxylate ABC transporter [Vibrio sp. UCD-FRSSP16_10]|uniref:TRAP transporter small permease subunit n=1 Tax=unclassified Vibrio TaxID=2614977 RepID=UPI0007FDB53A|nr:MULTISPECIES: TRAP transporter small permease subunit [unclassified Vibrio]OBT13152.1 C4-dicarboxylate ABC transporter [Vibrio sp. UCD-FRSSP16_30]OBT19553.1 C4-dicarboxylate ABC transporter [Vibrio sp. UCD-FRSSP16_10]
MLTILEGIFNRISNTLGHISSVLFLLLVANVVYDVLMRYVFNDVSIAFQEMEWHLFSAVFLLGVPYAIKTGGHVRVDIFYERFSPRVQALIDIFGTLVWLLPFSLLVAWYGIDFAYQAYDMGETSGDPGGLPYRWIIKAVIPISFLFIAISGLGLLCKSLNQFLNPNTHNKEEA